MVLQRKLKTAILGDYKPLDKDKSSISADIQPGDKIYGPVIAALVEGFT